MVVARRAGKPPLLAAAALLGAAAAVAGVESRAPMTSEADRATDPVDLVEHMRSGVRHIYAALDRGRGCRPYFRWVPRGVDDAGLNPFGGRDPIPHARHHELDTPHTTGRFLDALARCNAIADMPRDDEADGALARLIYRCFGAEDLPANDTETERGEAWMHHGREVLLALVGLHRWKRDPAALPRAARFVRELDRLSRETGALPGCRFDGTAWTAHSNQESVASTMGRMISSLLLYARVSDDGLGLELAGRFARSVREQCFTEAGELTDAAGEHMHSIEGTVTGLIAYGLAAGDPDYVALGKRLYDVGLRPYRMSTGWAQETRRPGGTPSGEANNTTDLIQIACLLAEAGHVRYYQDAERMIRNGLLRSQVRDTSWIPTCDSPPADTGDMTFRDIAARIRGAFCFARPNAFLAYNADLVGGGLQGLCEAWNRAITTKNGRTRVNLYFSRKSDAIDLVSHLPRQGVLELIAHRDVDLAVRVPIWAEEATAAIDGDAAPSAVAGGYLQVGAVRAGSNVLIRFQPVAESSMTEHVSPGTYTTWWLGDTVVGIDPPGRIMPLYPPGRDGSPSP